MQIPEPTDVLTFDLGSEPPRRLAGDIVVSGETARRAAREGAPACDRAKGRDRRPALDPVDAAFFRETWSERLATYLDDDAGRDAGRAELARVLTPVRALVGERPVIAGSAPAYADYILFGYTRVKKLLG